MLTIQKNSWNELQSVCQNEIDLDLPIVLNGMTQQDRDVMIEKVVIPNSNLQSPACPVPKKKMGLDRWVL